MNEIKIVRLRHLYYSYIMYVQCRCLHIDAYYWFLSLNIISRIFNDSHKFLSHNVNGVEYLNTYLNIVFPLVSPSYFNQLCFLLGRFPPTSLDWNNQK